MRQLLTDFRPCLVSRSLLARGEIIDSNYQIDESGKWFYVRPRTKGNPIKAQFVSTLCAESRSLSWWHVQLTCRNPSRERARQAMTKRVPFVPL